MSIELTWHRWLERADESLQPELRAMDAHAVEDAFYRELDFGTGGLRGVIGAGTNRMNIHTVAKASQGLADYLNHTETTARRVAISYDSRSLSDVFARVTAGVLAANGIEAMVFSEMSPTPCLSYAVRALGCGAGVMITASHNSAQYNGYKVFGPDGCQITIAAAEGILACIERLDVFDDVRSMDCEQGRREGRIRRIDDRVMEDFIERVKAQSLLGAEDADKGAAIVYTPLNGTGFRPVMRVLSECGYSNVTVVEEQARPDGRFPTCPYPNPELREAMALGMEYARRMDAELLLATDPDCDRCGVAVRDGGDYRLLSGNETGILLLDYICRRRIALGTMPEKPVMIKTIVTTDMACGIAARYGLETINVLTGFKYIGETIGRLEAAGQAERFVFAFEESNGCLSGDYVRDKDAVGASLLICEMFAWYRSRGVSLLQRLKQLYDEFGYCLNRQHCFAFEGSAGLERMHAIMTALRSGVDALGGERVLKVLDYSDGLDGLPKTDLVRLLLNGASVSVRPSGTEPKLKIYTSVIAPDPSGAAGREAALMEDLARVAGFAQ